MNEPQIWTLIGIFGAGLLGMITFTSQVMWKTITNQFESLRNEMSSELGSIRKEMGSEIKSLRTEMRSEFSAVRTEMDSMRNEIAHIDRDVQAITKRLLSD